MPPRSKSPLPEPAADGADEPRPARARLPKPPARTVVDVTAVLVAHDGASWLPEALSALAASTVVPARVVCVDTGSTDGSAALMSSAHGEVLSLPRTTGYGEAVAAALRTVPASTWVWLLHDDLAVEPTTLQALLEHAETSPSAALLGPKVRDWRDPRVLVEVGLTTDAAGHRETGLERREYDQGQHDAVRDVLAVGTAGALVRRDVWDAVGGLDPELPVFRDDLDLGWKVNAAGHRVVVVPEARVRHARAATTGHRETDAAPGRATGTDRKNALYVLLAHASGLRLLGLLPRLLLGTAFRSLGLLLTRQVADAGDEWRAVAATVGRPGRLARARR
ncbi:MAG: glycosyltransferase family 2 protein, partial [Mycobacteriales bacterium]